METLENLERKLDRLLEEPDNYELYQEIGIVLYDIGDWKNAEMYLERAYRLNSQDGDILYNYGLLLYLLDRWEAAAEIFKKYLELFPDDREVLKKAGDSCYLSGDYASAAKAYQRLTKEAGES